MKIEYVHSLSASRYVYFGHGLVVKIEMDSAEVALSSVAAGSLQAVVVE